LPLGLTSHPGQIQPLAVTFQIADKSTPSTCLPVKCRSFFRSKYFFGIMSAENLGGLMNRRRKLLAVAWAALTMTSVAFAQSYPTKPIRLIVPFAPSGSVDLIGRTVAQKLTEQLGVSVIVDNRTGAGGSIGTELVVKSPPDGYTLLVATVSVIAVNPALYGSKLSFNTERDLAPISMLVLNPQAIAVHPNVPAKSLNEFIALARARPGRLTYGSSGNGTSNQLIGAMLASSAKINLVHVPYKGGSPALIALLGGEVDMVVAQLPAVVTFHRSGKLRVLAISGAKRSPALPGVQTLVESRLQGLDVVSWTGILAPAGTPRSIINRLNTEIVKALNVPETRNRLTEDGSEVETSTPDAFASFIKSEMPKWAKAVKDAGAKAD
jgi:tripartite-type tricarboxylate transporter receptor subunit TctC